jgi:hypothetical protein
MSEPPGSEWGWSKGWSTVVNTVAGPKVPTTPVIPAEIDALRRRTTVRSLIEQSFEVTLVSFQAARIS